MAKKNLLLTLIFCYSSFCFCSATNIDLCHLVQYEEIASLIEDNATSRLIELAIQRNAFYQHKINTVATARGMLLHFATACEHIDAIKYLLKQGANVNIVYAGYCPLHLAAKFNRLTAAKLLVMHGGKVLLPANISQIKSPIQTAIDSHGVQSEIAQYLIEVAITQQITNLDSQKEKTQSPQ